MADRPFTVLAHDIVIADRARALILREADYPPVYYLRREDITMALLERTAQTSWCPFKGRASYYSVKGDLTFENAVWSYEDPFLEAAPIKDHMAFYADRDGLIVKAAGGRAANPSSGLIPLTRFALRPRTRLFPIPHK